MNGMRQKVQYSLALELVVQGETPVSSYQGAEPFVAKLAPESPALTEQLMEEVCDRGNLVRAWKRVRQNKGSPGVDGMTIDDTKDYLREHWPSLNSIEPPWYGPVCPVVWEGRRREVSPYPDLR